MHGSYLENKAGLAQLATFFQVATGLLIVELFLWIIAIASSG